MLADEVVFRAPGGISGAGKAACVAFFFGSWFGTCAGTHPGVLHGPTGDLAPSGRSVRVDYLQVLRFRAGRWSAARDRAA